MYLKKLSLRGFKSFASVTSLEFEPGITCIVGPNGSGKSNVVDALAWVMGEQGAKSLRGASMEDVIFAGAASRAPLGRAEIQLTIDNTDGALPIDYSEVTIARTKFRNGNSEYSINGTACRLLDVRELLSDSGIGREMHVIVGQGHLDQILQATPETRRGFIEEAAGVLKHRERKEKALRKLDATQANLHRLTDLLAEIRRQLKPLGRQAEVAQRATEVQADLRDAKARLLADDLAQALAVLGPEGGEGALLTERRHQVETALAQARQGEDKARAAMAASAATHRTAQELWFALSGIGERVRSLVTVATERVRNAETAPAQLGDTGQDPDTLLAQADALSAGEERMREEITQRGATLRQASAERAQAEAAHAVAVTEFESASKEDSHRREIIARLSGQITSSAARLETGAERICQLRAALGQAQQGLNQATSQYDLALESLPGLDAGEQDLDTTYDSAQIAARAADHDLDALKIRAQEVTQAVAAASARVEALRLAAQTDRDGAGWLAANASQTGIRGALADMVSVEAGYERAVTAGLGAVAEAVVATDLDASVRAVQALREGEHGRAEILVARDHRPAPAPPTHGGPRMLVSVISAEPAILAGLSQILQATYVAETIDQARELLADHPEAVVVTRSGERLSGWWVSGGSDTGQSALQIAAALVGADAELTRMREQARALEQEVESATDRRTQAEEVLAQAVRALHESDAALAAVQEQLSQLNQAVLQARTEVARLENEVAKTEQEALKDRQTLAELNERLEAAKASHVALAPSPLTRDNLAEVAKKARQSEMEARLGLRTLEERARALVGQVDALRATAAAQEAARARAEERRSHLARQAATSRSVQLAGQWLLGRVELSQAAAGQRRDEAAQARAQSEAEAESARIETRDLGAELDSLVDAAHREELARAQQRMRIDTLEERALAEVGLDAGTLMEQYGPDKPIPIGGEDPATGEVNKKPYIREEQLKRFRAAERDLQLLGRVNPLALEEYDAMQERHRFLANQLEDLKKTRADLLAIVEDVDTRVQRVFAEAFADVEREFSATFSRLFPGGEGRLVLSEPGQWLTTGIDVEARPAGKKVKRLSLLSGGERSLVAVCFLIALFKARPSPFYILDEVEAALDDTNLGRLLQIYEELRTTSQLLIITHQKRTMEIADTLYGVTMGSDGTSTVVSQRLRDG